MVPDPSWCAGCGPGGRWPSSRCRASLPMLPLIRQPTLILSGTDDPIIPVANARLMRRAIPHSQLHLFDDGHLGLITSASDLAPVVAGFLGSQAHAG
ncbi:alpha/beta fold hydrolase [Branchiibius hedensis]|uniref:alpha/beta fold hydrolase n=1 Tax=Branchiibius hedensis TaxID=672460 RepID=UPI002482AB80|nr:alpha/beta fold hydrolase [Branchiibius hedensis]